MIKIEDIAIDKSREYRRICRKDRRRLRLRIFYERLKELFRRKEI